MWNPAPWKPFWYRRQTPSPLPARAAGGETLENYIKRLEKLEEIANSFEGVDKSFAMQAGREVRILVKPKASTMQIPS